MKYKKNEGMHTSTEAAIQNILTGLLNGPNTASGCGYCAFPGYRFLTPQGAALSVGKILSKMRKDGLITRHSNWGYQITRKGREAVQAHKQQP